ncbi:MAG: hypothetical protein IPP91_09765 [Betaproteobacteria bacterium]|nr:hypothetical protein [Betaproteobacteria bacterium]
MKELTGKALCFAVMALMFGCAAQPPLTEVKQSQAMQTALTRARFDMNCPAATGTVLSSQDIEPLVSNPRFRGPERAQFTIGVEGCGKRQTLVVLCSEDNAGCFAADGNRR